MCFPLYAQVVNTGGGGPDKSDKGNQPSEEYENPHVVAERNKTIEADLKNWFVHAKADWKKCYKNSLNAKDIIQLYTYMTIQIEKKTIKPKIGCEEGTPFDCLFKDDKHNSELYKIISEKSFHNYLKTKGIDQEKSRNQFIKYFHDRIVGK